MKLKKIISVFLILVLSIQLLPLKQIVSWLSSGQMTEEIVHANDSGKNNSGLEEIHKHFPDVQHLVTPHSIYFSTGSIYHDAEALIRRHADDIPTPPPNC
jgi:hypothetical protein